ncbi:MAG: glycosyl hydrolase [Desulfovibrio sp.]|nr:glycosyl hydrolase [Desulfovibrio sp.]
MKFLLLATQSLWLFCCAVPAFSATSAWVAEWDMKDGLAEVRQGKFNDIILFAAYFTPEGKPFLTPSLQRAVSGGVTPYLEKGQGLYLSVVNDVVRAPGQSVMKDPQLVKKLMISEQSRNQHRQDLLNLLASGPFTGLEIDYEKVDTEDWPVLLDFAQELHGILAAQGKKLRFLLEPKKRYLTSNLPSGPEYVIMGYNLYGGHSGPGPKADADFLGKLAQWTAHMPQKPGMALAAGGFAWGLGKVISLDEGTAAAWAKSANAKVRRDEKSGGLYFVAAGNIAHSPVPSRDANGDVYEVWYADGATLAHWADVAKKLGFGEISVWRLGGNTGQSLMKMAEALP